MTAAPAPPHAAPGPGAAPGPALESPAVTLRRSGRAPVEDVTLSLRGGEVLALVGPNGSDKSTLLRLVAGGAPWDLLQAPRLSAVFGLPFAVLHHPTLDCPLVVPLPGTERSEPACTSP